MGLSEWFSKSSMILMVSASEHVSQFKIGRLMVNGVFTSLMLGRPTHARAMDAIVLPDTSSNSKRSVTSSIHFPVSSKKS